jgi:HK97 family phage major capsid protein
MSFDVLRASRAELQDFLSTADRAGLMTAMREIDAANEGREITGDLGGFYRAASDAVLAELEELRDLVSRGVTEDGTPFPRSGRSSGGTKPFRARGQAYEAAMRTVDASVRSGDLEAYSAERVESLLTTGLPTSRNLAARWAVVAGDEAYATAFAKMVADPERGHLMWTREEGEAYRRASAVNDELRAMSTTGSAGGFMIPLTLDPAIILTSSGSINPLRRLARVVQTVTNEWRGVTSAGVSAEWIAEATEVADATPTLAQPPIPVYKGDAFTTYSFEVGMDAVDLLGQLKMVLSDAADQLQATAFTTGGGSTLPTGLITALVASSPSVLVPSAVTDTFGKADVYALQNALPPRFSANAQWVANIAVLNLMSQMETTNGARLFPELSDGRLLNKPISELSNMDGVVNASAENYVLLYGEFKNFVIVDRIGSQLELVPQMFGASGRRPTGQRGALLWFRTGSDSVNDAAFRLLNVT